MKYVTRSLVICLVSLFATVQAATAATPADSSLKIATWNMEHFAYPMDSGCRPRSQNEIAAVRAYLQTVNADIYAVEEVASEQALRQVFPQQDWQIIFSARPDSDSYLCRGSDRHSSQQKVALVLRKAITVLRTEQAAQFSVNDPGLRYGVSATVQTHNGPLNLLAVHLKSGCFVDDFRSKDSEACHLLARQAPVLQQWVAQHNASGEAYMILGDFNHRLGQAHNHLTQLIRAAAQPASRLTLATEQLISCHPRFPAPIDHIWLGNIDAKQATPAVTYPFADMHEDAMLSDHCAVSVNLQGF